MTTTSDTFPARIRGTVLREGDDGYDAARRVWNGEIDRRPALIVRVAGPDDVATALAHARETGLDVTVRGGGHNFGGAAVAEGALMIDLGALRTIEVDAGRRTARVGGGATWAELDAATQEHGLATPGGTVSDTGVGGLTLGGGFGWLTPRHGLTIDNLVSAEVVTADGRVLRASETEHPDLFWALRGGGGNFGVVTEFEFRLHPVGPLVELGMFFWGLDDAPAALRFAREVLADLPDGTGAMLAGLTAPPAPFVPAEHHGAPGVALVVAGFDGPERHAEVVTRIRAGLPARFELVTPIPYTELQKLLDGGAPRGLLAYEKSLYLDELTDDVLDVVAAHLPGKSSPLSLMPVFPVRGAFSAVPDEATAFGGARRDGFVFGIATVAPTPELHAADRAWTRAFWSALTPFAANVGGYVNFMAEYEEDRVRASYGAEKYARLRRIKAAYDPGNVFHHNANIPPTGT
ncbi:MAG TPA: FAD-binding oxidoreductase [Amycolatopsis sp.]|uniref:FAD-binding oxidoreductase n=1 Tax=Amycolatopsis sp. TaxID=37632 RepID=UPI002F41C95C